MFIRKFSRHTFLTLLSGALVLTACNIGAAPAPTIDVNAMNTAVVGTTVAQLSIQFTQTALAVPSTPLPTDTQASLPTFETLPSVTPDANGLPTFSLDASPTPLAGFTQIVPATIPPAGTAPLGDSCSNSAFEGDITIPDGTVLDPGVNFQKIWKIRNTGTCLWDDGFTLVYIGGSKDDLDPYNFQFKKSSDFVAAGEAINIPINLTTPCAPGKYEGHWRMRNDKGYYFGTILSVYVEVKQKCK